MYILWPANTHKYWHKYGPIDYANSRGYPVPQENVVFSSKKDVRGLTVYIVSIPKEVTLKNVIPSFMRR